MFRAQGLGFGGLGFRGSTFCYALSLGPGTLTRNQGIVEVSLL